MIGSLERRYPMACLSLLFPVLFHILLLALISSNPTSDVHKISLGEQVLHYGLAAYIGFQYGSSFLGVLFYACFVVGMWAFPWIVLSCVYTLFKRVMRRSKY